jgi:alpha-ketoglutarate-dependent taurine dioxygenase
LAESFESIIENIETHLDKFKKDAIIVFRGLKFSRQQQVALTRRFGDEIGWYPNSSSWPAAFWSYEENHSHTMDRYDKHDVPKDELFLSWHLEHMGHKNPAIGATWNMEKFTCDHGVGNTLFVNISDIYDMFNKEETDFLKKCKVAAVIGQEEPVLHDAVELYEPSGRFSLRLNALFKYDRETFYLHSYDGREPSIDESDRFMNLSLRFTDNVHKNEDIQQVHMWQENDLVVVDLFLMVHAVLGGFKPSERFFYGCWARRQDFSKH